MAPSWTRCPLAAVNKLARIGRVRISWTTVRLEILPNRTLQYYRCMKRGHVRAECSSVMDRSSKCYRCGGEGHVTRECSSPAHCPVCAEAGVRANHRVGGKACNPPDKRKRDKGRMAPISKRRALAGQYGNNHGNHVRASATTKGEETTSHPGR